MRIVEKKDIVERIMEAIEKHKRSSFKEIDYIELTQDEADELQSRCKYPIRCADTRIGMVAGYKERIKEE